MKSLLMGIAAAFALSWASQSTAQVRAVTGNFLLEQAAASNRLDAGSKSSRDYQEAAYLAGFAFGTATALNNVDPEVCLPEGANTRQLIRVLIQYLEANPAELHAAGSTLALAAFRKAFPCRYK